MSLTSKQWNQIILSLPWKINVINLICIEIIQSQFIKVYIPYRWTWAVAIGSSGYLLQHGLQRGFAGINVLSNENQSWQVVNRHVIGHHCCCCRQGLFVMHLCGMIGQGPVRLHIGWGKIDVWLFQSCKVVLEKRLGLVQPLWMSMEVVGSNEYCIKKCIEDVKEFVSFNLSLTLILKLLLFAISISISKTYIVWHILISTARSNHQGMT